jgi:hypothetical protein
MLSVIMLNVTPKAYMLSVIMMNVVMLSVVVPPYGPYEHPKETGQKYFTAA